MRKALRLIHSLSCWLIAFLIILILGMTIVLMTTLLLARKKKVYYWGKAIWARIILFVGAVAVRRIGLENVPRSGNFIFAANHSSSLDILVVAATIPIKFFFVMDEILFKIPLLGFYSKMAGDLPISRRSPMRALEQMQTIVAALKAGESIAFFPEGMRSRDGKLREFKSGIGMLVEETGVPVVPVAVSGTFDLMPRMNPVFLPGRVTVQFGPPLYLDKEAGQKQNADAIHAKVEAMLSSQIK